MRSTQSAVQVLKSPDCYTGRMKALVITRFGGPEVLELQQAPDPHAGPEQSLVRVEAGGLNFADLLTARGGYAGTPKPPLVAGREFAGVEVTNGRRVMGYTQWAAFAEKTAAHRALLWPVPEEWSAEQAAAFPVNFFTAYFAYWKAGLIEKPAGTRVLIHAVAGGVGTAAVQIGKILGVEMYGTSSSEDKLARVRKLGLQHGINYKQRDYQDAIKDLTRGEGVDAVFEMLGGEHVAKSVKCLREFGRVIVYGAATGETPLLDTRLLYAKGASVHGLWLSYLSQNRPLMDIAWKQVSQWLQERKLHPVIGKVFPLAEARAAYTLMQEGKNYGKVVLKIGENPAPIPETLGSGTTRAEHITFFERVNSQNKSNMLRAEESQAAANAGWGGASKKQFAKKRELPQRELRIMTRTGKG
jgi:NADPH2:quinone reductase